MSLKSSLMRSLLALYMSQIMTLTSNIRGGEEKELGNSERRRRRGGRRKS